MADYIFTMDTSLKKDMYSTIVNLFLNNGWTNISSNPTTDFDVLKSPSEDGTKNLMIQLRPTSAAGTNSTVTTDYNLCSYRLISSYTPNAAVGTAGTFARTTTAEAWRDLYLLPTVTAYSKDTTNLTYRYHVNKNRLIIGIETPPGLGLGAVVHYIGLPDVNYCNEINSTGLLVGSTCGALTVTNVMITDAPSDLPALTASSARPVVATLAQKNPNTAGRYMISEMYYGSATEGTRGKLTGLFVLPNQAVLNGDTITIGTKQYYVYVAGVVGNNSFSSLALAVQMV